MINACMVYRPTKRESKSIELSFISIITWNITTKTYFSKGKKKEIHWIVISVKSTHVMQFSEFPFIEGNPKSPSGGRFLVGSSLKLYNSIPQV